MGKGTLRTAAITAIVLALAVAVPAAAGPSLSSVAKKAKKALSTAQKANKTANTALTLALAGPPVAHREQKDVPALPQDFAEFDVKCPAGYYAVGIGQGLGALIPVFFASYGGGALGSMFNPSTSSTYKGSMYVECVKSAGRISRASASTPRMTKTEALSRLRQAEADAAATK